jgi:PAS domain S-box-containing protein
MSAKPRAGEGSFEQLPATTEMLAAKVVELKAANRRLTALTEVNLRLASERDPRVLLDGVCREACLLVGADVALLCVGGANEARTTATWGLDAAATQALVCPRLDAKFFSHVATGQGPDRYADPHGDAANLGLPAGFPLARSALAAPIASLTVVYGWLCLLNKAGTEAFDDDDVRMLVGLAAQVGRIYESDILNAELLRHTARLKVEVEERERSAAQLRESDLRFRQLAENVHEVFFLVGPSFAQMIYVSPAYEEIWGRTCASLYERPGDWWESIHPDDRARMAGAFGPQADVAAFDVEYRIVRPSGGLRWVRARGFPIRDEHGHPYRLAGIAEDITEGVHMEQVLREREASLRRADGIARLAHMVTRPDGTFQSWSDLLPELIGRDPELVPPDTEAWLAIVHADDRERVRAICAIAAANTVRTEVDYRIVRGDGQGIHVRQVLDPILDSASRKGTVRWFNTVQDITDQKRAEETLRESERRFSDMLANIELLTVMLDHDARITYCNDCLLEVTGWSREEVLGGDWFEIFQPPDAGETRVAFESLLEGKSDAQHYTSRILSRKGAPRLIRWNNSMLRSPSGQVIGTASVGEDVTERELAEDEVRRLNTNLERLVAERTAQLQAANKELEAFSYSVSHDLRAPLQAIQGYAQALQESPTAGLEDTDRHYLERIRSRSAAMDLLIDDLLSLARISRSDLVTTDVDMSALANEVVSELRRADPLRRSEVAVRAGMRARGDAGLLRMVLTNLLANAWKFSGGRETTVIEVGQVAAPEGGTTFFVRDQGAGFDPAYSEKLFGTFQRLHTQKEFPGTGIGLATVQRVIDRHGGEVRAEGAVGRGATFYFTLPGRPSGVHVQPAVDRQVRAGDVGRLV